jgi:hypothetical protein
MDGSPQKAALVKMRPRREKDEVEEKVNSRSLHYA